MRNSTFHYLLKCTGNNEVKIGQAYPGIESRSQFTFVSHVISLHEIEMNEIRMYILALYFFFIDSPGYQRNHTNDFKELHCNEILPRNVDERHLF